MALFRRKEKVPQPPSHEELRGAARTIKLGREHRRNQVLLAKAAHDQAVEAEQALHALLAEHDIPVEAPAAHGHDAHGGHGHEVHGHGHDAHGHDAHGHEDHGHQDTHSHDDGAAHHDGHEDHGHAHDAHVDGHHDPHAHAPTHH